MKNFSNENKLNSMHFLFSYFPLVIVFILVSSTSFTQKPKNNSLFGHPVTSIDLKYDESDAAKPGNSLKIGVTALLSDGTTMLTTGWLKGKVKWTDFDVQVTGGTLGAGLTGGNVIINSDPSTTKDHAVTIKVTSLHDSNWTATISISINYNVAHELSFNGTEGQSGSLGQKGESGGTDGSIYNKTYGSDGKPGQNGGDGTDGRAGIDAQGIKVYVTTTNHKIGNNTLVQVVVTDANGQNIKYYIFDPVGGSMTISANGGQGGSGGSGGDGGAGGHGQNVEGDSVKKQTGGNGGNAGNGGNGGAGGDGGDGGAITIYYDPSAEEFLSKISTSNVGGRGGNSGSGGQGGAAGTGGNGYNSGKHGTQGKTGQRSTQNGLAGNDGPPVSKIKQAVDLKQFGIE